MAVMPAVKTDTVFADRLVPVELEQDSLLLTALLECDSARRVVLRRLEQSGSGRLAGSAEMSGDTLVMRAVTAAHDTVFVRGADRIVTVERPVAVVSESRGEGGGWRVAVPLILAFVLLIFVLRR